MIRIERFMNIASGLMTLAPVALNLRAASRLSINNKVRIKSVQDCFLFADGFCRIIAAKTVNASTGWGR